MVEGLSAPTRPDPIDHKVIHAAHRCMEHMHMGSTWEAHGVTVRMAETPCRDAQEAKPVLDGGQAGETRVRCWCKTMLVAVPGCGGWPDRRRLAPRHMKR